jgi:uncharacterized protein YegL
VDIAVGADERVYVAYVRTGPAAPGGVTDSAVALEGAGIWVFEPAESPGRDAVQAGACWTGADKTAAPSAVRVGDEVTVTLSVQGGCPGAAAPAQVVVLLDTSRSMNWEEAIDRAKQASLAALGVMDSRAVDVALVTFDDDADLVVPLTREHARVAASIAAAEAWGDSHLAAGLQAATAELGGERRAAGARQLIVLVTDGEYADAAGQAAQAARAAGIDIVAVALPHGSASTAVDKLAAVTGDRSRVLVEPDPETAALAARALAGYRQEPGLFAAVEVTDRIAADMRLVPGSPLPAALLDGDTLRWRLADVAASSGVEVRYRLQPLAPGVLPTNVEASAAYTDALGSQGSLSFPVPFVYAWDMSLLGEHLYLPYGQAQAGLWPVGRSAPLAQPAPPGPDFGLATEPGGDEAPPIYLPFVSRPEPAQRFASDLEAARARYPNIQGTRLNQCRLCHVMDEAFRMNPYGRDYVQHGRDFGAIEPLDSDGDGFSNIDEILALTFPGWADSHPAIGP